MNPNELTAIHVLAGFVLVGFILQASIAPRPEARRRLMVYTGLASLAMLASGLYLAHAGGFGFPKWLIVKLGCWLALSALTGLAFRLPSLARLLSLVAIALVALALYCVYLKPF